MTMTSPIGKLPAGPDRRNGRVHPAIIFFGGGLVGLLGLFAVASLGPTAPSEQRVVVYCAASLEPSVKAIAEKYRAEIGPFVEIRAGNSGSLAAQIAASEQGDLYLPADDSFLQTAFDKGFVAERIPLATMQLVVGVPPGNPRRIASLEDLCQKDLTIGMANPQAAVGKVAHDILSQLPKGRELLSRPLVNHTTVTESALAVQSGHLDAAFMWDVVAKKSRLEAVSLAELSPGVGRIAVGVLKTTRQPAAALRFARYLAAPDRGQLELNKAGFQTAAGDPWTFEPTLTFFSGGIQRPAIKETLREFEEREGCKINVVYEGCGVLLGMMRGDQPRLPDAYFACDRSFLSPGDIQPLFFPPRELTETRMVILVHRGNPKHIRGLDDLARPDLKLGVAHETNSALGALTKSLLQSRGIYDAVRNNVRSDGAAKADLLVTQMLAGGPDALDAVIVYEANASQARKTLDLVPIDIPAANAVQSLARSRNSSHHQMLGRLFDALASKVSQERFEQAGFRWRFQGEAAP